jgi:hypothetical protein
MNAWAINQRISLAVATALCIAGVAMSQGVQAAGYAATLWGVMWLPFWRWNQ